MVQRRHRTSNFPLCRLPEGPTSFLGERLCCLGCRSPRSGIKSQARIALQPGRKCFWHLPAASGAVPKNSPKTQNFALFASAGFLAEALTGARSSITLILAGGSFQRAVRFTGRRQLAFFLALAALLLSPPAPRAQSLRIAAASDLQFAMDELASRYQQQTEKKLTVIYGSSGNFYAQIQNGAPFDLFFSADLLYAQKLIDIHLAEPDSFFVYARGQLALWAPAGAHLNLSQSGFAVLRDPRVQKIAIANPDHAPYGRAAVAALQRAGVYEQIKSKLVFGENISQAAQFAQSGSAQVGILALSLVLSPNMQSGDRWLIPADLFPTLDQAAVLLTVSPNKNEARAFLEFIKSDTAREVLSRHGFTLPESIPAKAAKQKP
jgi:molybdate transport system substrate-binding protein